MRSAATAVVLLLCLLATGAQAQADLGSGSTVVRTMFSLWKGLSAEAAKSTQVAPLVSVGEASTAAVAAVPSEHALDLLFTAEDAPVDHRHEHKRPRLHLMTKYIVKPSTGKDFVETVLDIEADVKNETGYVFYKLYKTASDDLTFYSYQVWETAKDFFKHIKSDAVKPLGKLIIDEDIPIFVTAVLPIRKAPHHGPHGPHHGPHGPHGPHDGPHGPHDGPHGPHDGPHGPHDGPHGPHHGPHDGPHGPHDGPHGPHHGPHGDHHGPHHGPHGHGKDHDHDHHHHDHRDHEHDEGLQDLDWLSAVAQPAHAQRDVLADTARTALEKLAEQGTSGELFGSDEPDTTELPPFENDWEEVGPAAVEAEQKEAETWRYWDRKLLHRRFVEEPHTTSEHGNEEEEEDDMEEWETSVLAPPALHMMAFDDADGNHTHGNGTHFHPTVLTKFVVRPGLARCFVGAYMRLKEEASEEKGNLVFGLIKPLDDNLVFYGFSKWESPCAIKKHVRKPYARRFAGFIEKANIPVEVTLLAPIEKKTNTTMMLPAV